MSVVLPPKGDALAIERQQSVIANGNPMRVAAEIAEHLSRPAEGRFGVDHPVLSEYGAQKGGELFGGLQRCDGTMETGVSSVGRLAVAA